jgi:6-phosphogluconolactonase (cycloisomerase 2 family)
MAVVASPTPAGAQSVPCLSGTCESWVARYDGPSHLQDSGAALVVAPDGAHLYVVGTSQDSSNGPDLVLTSYDAATGTQAWLRRYDGPAHGSDAAADVAISPDGSVLVAIGQSEGAGADFATIAYDAATGTQRWAARAGGPLSDVPTKVAVSEDGQRVYVTGYSSAGLLPIGVDNYDLLTVAYAVSDGHELWRAAYDNGNWETNPVLAVGSVPGADGPVEQVYVSARSDDGGLGSTHADYVTFAYDARSGARNWSVRYDGPAHDSDQPHAITRTPDGTRLIVTGESVGSGTEADYATVAYDTASGAQVWASRYATPQLDLGLGLAVSPDGSRVAITGFSVNDSGVPYDRSAATVVYRTDTGAQQWVARHGEPDGADGVAAAYDPAGRHLYVAGTRGDSVFYVNQVTVYDGQALTLALDPATGAEQWVGRYAGTTVAESNKDIAVTPDGSRVFVTGGGQAANADVATLSYAGEPAVEPVVPEAPYPVLLLLVPATGVAMWTLTRRRCLRRRA